MKEWGKDGGRERRLDTRSSGLHKLLGMSSKAKLSVLYNDNESLSKYWRLLSRLGSTLEKGIFFSPCP
jgi:hypothetical protein